MLDNVFKKKKRPRPALHRAGDFIVNKYMPNATPAEREEARENLVQLASILKRIDDRLVAEKLGRIPAPES